ncbi:MAG: IS200/IS605 family transposase, partial [Croceibacterium sp.]
HIVWAPKYRYKVLIGDVRLRVRDVVRQVSAEMGVNIVSGALSKDHVHLFVEIPPHISVSQFVQKAKGRSSRRIQQEFEHSRANHARGGVVQQPQAGVRLADTDRTAIPRSRACIQPSPHIMPVN